MAWLLEGLALTLFLPPSWEERLESLAQDFQILLWNSHDGGSSVIGGCSYLKLPYLVGRGSRCWLFLMFKSSILGMHGVFVALNLFIWVFSKLEACINFLLLLQQIPQT